MTFLQQQYGAKRVYEVTPKDGNRELRLSDRMVELGEREYGLYQKLAAWLPSVEGVEVLATDLGIPEAKIEKLCETLEGAGLLFKKPSVPRSMSGLEFHKRFNEVLSSWLSEAFSHPFWARMMEGRGSKRLFSGWMLELYHYTKNANRHMPLSCAMAHEKPIKQLRAKHYAEEWNHYHYFMKSLKALGFEEKEVETSVPLPMTLALSNFMRQAARHDVLAYSICSAVLEGTTVERGTYNPYYQKSAELYGVPKEAIKPIYDHLDLDVQYQHSDLFKDILEHVPQMPAERVSTVLDYGHQLVEHIWLWTENIEKYYQADDNPMPRLPFDIARD